MHRGASLQNSEQVCGLVLHTSTDCKLIMNQGKYGFKQSKLYKGINALMAFNILLIVSIAAVFAALNYSFVTDYEDTAEYLFQDADPPSEQAGRAFFSFYLLFNQFVPMELLISLEMVQIVNVVFMDNDSEMTYVEPDRGQLGCQAKNMTLHEDLGQVNFLFCDKTGTLTQNELVFKKWACGGTVLPDGREAEALGAD